MSTTPGSEPELHEPSIAELCRYFLRLGASGFGGPVALAGYMQRDLVEERGWVTPQEYRDGLAVAQVAPGPLAAQLAMWLAFVRHGVRGATFVSLAFVAPAFLIVVALAWIYVAAGGAAWVGSVFYGVAPAAIAIIALSAYRLTALTLGRDPLLIAIASVLVVLTIVTGSEVAVAFVASGLLVVLVRHDVRPALRRMAARLHIGSAAVSILGPLVPAGAWQVPLLWEMLVYFSFAGAFVFGSGLAIVPFLHQGLVLDHGWLTEQQFLDSVAVGLITPGPVVITASFAGFLIAGLPGALVGTIGVFLPAYLLVVLPGHWILRHKDAPLVRGFISGVSAAATGAIIGAVVVLGRRALVDGPTVLIAASSLVALVAIRRWKPPFLGSLAEPTVVLVSGVVGILLRGA
jgi:chromate transporter